MNIAAAISLLQLALSLLTTVQGATNIPQSLIDAANKTASQAVAQAQTILLAQHGTTEEAGTPITVIPDTTNAQPDTNTSTSGTSALGPNAAGSYTPITLGSAYDYSGSDAASQLLHALNPSGASYSSNTPSVPDHPITVTDPAPSNATCVSGSSTYQSGTTVGCPERPGSGVICAIGPVFTKWKCAGGMWSEAGTGDSTGIPTGGAPNDACTFSNTPLGSQCGGYYHCGVGVAGNYWSATLTSACTMAR